VSKPCVFFDRDGIVNRAPESRYVERLEDFYLHAEFVEALKIVRGKGWEAVIITNQKGVSTGKMSMEAVNHDHLQAELRKKGVELTDILVCTDPNDDSPRRKPNPGMLLEAAEKHGLDLAKSWMVGDQEKDVEAGRRAGCRTVFVGAGNPHTRADFRVETLAGLAAFLEGHL
jgi:D-glycero-D-manno-heptose 1,7-bisphosphate phosphatase